MKKTKTTRITIVLDHDIKNKKVKFLVDAICALCNGLGLTDVIMVTNITGKEDGDE